jgi:hypothetical protein
MTELFTNYGEEWVQDLVINSGKTLEVGLYADADGPGTPSTTDTVFEGTDVSDLGTEPTGSNYVNATDAASNFTASLDASDNIVITGSQLEFDVSDSSQDVNAYYVAVPFASDVVGSDGGTETLHLIGTAYLDQLYDLNQFDTSVNFDPVKLTLD